MGHVSKMDSKRKMKEEKIHHRVDPLFRYESGKDVIYPEVKAWPPILEKLRDTIYEITGQRCNHCVVNQYRGEKDIFQVVFFVRKETLGVSSRQQRSYWFSFR